MSISLSASLEKLFLKEDSHSLSIDQMYEEIKGDFPDKDESKIRHSVRRAVQSLHTRGFIERTDKGFYTMKEN